MLKSNLLSIFKNVVMDCQYIPIAKEDFEKMAVFGSQRIRAAVVISSVT